MGKKKSKKRADIRPSGAAGGNAGAELKQQNPVGYFLRVAICAGALLLPIMVFETLFAPDGVVGTIPRLGWFGALLLGVALLNQAARLIGRYLGKWGSILPAGLGAILVGVFLLANH